MRGIILAICVSCLAAGCSEPETKVSSVSEIEAPAGNVAATPSGEEHGEWLLHGLSGGEQRFSPLDQINAATIGRLGLAFEYADFIVRGNTHRGPEATPLMDDGVLYFTGPWDVVYALNARNGQEIWVFDPEVEGARARVTCCDVVNRGLALEGGAVFVATTDGYLIALNKQTGDVIWKVDTFIERDSPHTITGAPRLAGDVIVIGNGGAEMGVRGYVTAFDIKTGEFRWRFFTVPGPGPDETPDITLARKTWSDQTPWDHGGGGTVWDSMVYEEATDTIYVGVGNGSPWPGWKRGEGKLNDNLYLSSIVALDAETGLAKWHYQTTPGDSWDYTATQHMVLADIAWQGESRPVIMQAPKNGFFYVLDRRTGELLSAEPFVPVSWASHVDMQTGRPVLTENADYSKQPRVISPGPGGGHNWPPMSFSPQTGLVYIPTLEFSSKFTTLDDGEGYQPNNRNTKALSTIATSKDADLTEGLPPIVLKSHIVGWDPNAGKPRWKSEAQTIGAGGVLTTAGNLVFAGSADGFLNIFNAETGELVRAVQIGTAIMAPPMSYELDGKQYIAVQAGAGGVGLRAFVPGSAARKFVNSERLLVFQLDGGDVSLPPPLEKPVENDIPTGLPTDPETLALGEKKFKRYCVRCHLPRNVPSGYPNLWNMSPTTDENFDDIVLNGAYAYAGMAGFGDLLTAEDALAMRAYIAEDRRKVQKGAKPGETEAH